MTAKERRHCADHYAAKLVAQPAIINKLPISPETPPIPYLSCYTDGRICRLCPTQQPTVYRSAESVRRHLKRDHSWQSGSQGGRPSGAGRGYVLLIEKVTISPVCCQTFYQRGGLVRFFQVTPVSAVPRVTTGITPRPWTMREQIDFDLAQRFRIIEQGSAASGLAVPRAAEVSPWLELTRWPEYFKGKDLEAAAHLLDLPTQRKTFVMADLERSSGLRYNEVDEKQLTCILESLDRLVDQARESIAQEKVNIFDQHKVNEHA